MVCAVCVCELVCPSKRRIGQGEREPTAVLASSLQLLCLLSCSLIPRECSAIRFISANPFLLWLIVYVMIPVILLAKALCRFERVEIKLQVRQRVCGRGPSHERIFPPFLCVPLQRPATTPCEGACLANVLCWFCDAHWSSKLLPREARKWSQTDRFWLFLHNVSGWNRVTLLEGRLDWVHAEMPVLEERAERKTSTIALDKSKRFSFSFVDTVVFLGQWWLSRRNGQQHPRRQILTAAFPTITIFPGEGREEKEKQRKNITQDCMSDNVHIIHMSCCSLDFWRKWKHASRTTRQKLCDGEII